MAAIYQEHSENGQGVEFSRQDIQSAIAKAVELRALHAALMQGRRSPPTSTYSASPVSRHAPHYSAQDYPVFTPSYDDEPLPGYQQIVLENRKHTASWGEYPFDLRNIEEEEIILSDHVPTANASSRKGLPSDPINASSRKGLTWSDHLMNSEVHKISVLKASPGPDYSRSRRNSLGDIKSLSSYNNCKPAVVSHDSDSMSKNSRKSNNIIVPLIESHSSPHSQPRNKGLNFSWLFPRLKKKNKNDASPIRPRSEDMSSQVLKGFGTLSVERVKKELIEAHESRDTALSEVAEMKSSVGELSQKLEYLETYCEELKKALGQDVQVQNSQQPVEKLEIRGKLVSEEVMVEGLVQVVSEARLSVKQFCKTLLGQIQESDRTLLENLNSLLQPYKVSLSSKHSKAVLYHLEAIINQSLYSDFENPVFQKNGAPKLLDPQQGRQARFQLFVASRNLSWNEVLRKGTKYYSDEFSKFCDEKMSGIIASLGWTRPWPEQLLQAFFAAAKCIWLLHLLAFSFDPPLGILRVDENRTFEARYMEDMLAEKQRPPQFPSRVKVLVMPGFYVHDQVLKCKVLCRYKSVV